MSDSVSRASVRLDQPSLCRAIQHYLNTLNLGNVVVTVLSVATMEGGEAVVRVEMEPHTHQEKAIVFEYDER